MGLGRPRFGRPPDPGATLSEGRATARQVSGRSPADTPLMRQYLEVKDQHPDARVLFRLGDFYEMFFEDAVMGSRLLDLERKARRGVRGLKRNIS